MPPRGSLPTLSAWKCPQCTARLFSTTPRQLAVGPEHPRFVEIPEPPQQTAPSFPPVKGVLPVPRNVFAGTPKDLSSDEQIALATKPPAREKKVAPRSREEWKVKMSELRRQNLREGLKSLKARQQSEQQRVAAQSRAKQAERMERLNMPEREDERLTASSNNLDLDALFNKPIPDPTREERLERKRLNVEAALLRKQEERMDALHSLYMNARQFIVTPEQLNNAVDKAFGTPENPVRFGVSMGLWDNQGTGKSIWAEGRPARVQDLLKRSKNAPSDRAMDDAVGHSEINKDRIRRIAESLTGGKMDKTARQ
ncbi:hypothetical protein CERZMDRAFT_90285 [Cercospora zeae-maydis SCOH1-5]|uniref:Uncharacterized protein n=1 Tax=Cercospora zeae-maydis SCOH1-5 TaxID=717836 RepID=A0A6A6FNU2_9PEZI|nr:hypothetical protein CERZMDRAFT_90285 [Cercospora zeae-maydis SCOH1-5]